MARQLVETAVSRRTSATYGPVYAELKVQDAKIMTFTSFCTHVQKQPFFYFRL